MREVFLVEKPNAFADHEYWAYSDEATARTKAGIVKRPVVAIQVDCDAEQLQSGLLPYSVSFLGDKISTHPEVEYVSGVTRSDERGSVIVSVIAKDAADATRRALKIYKNLAPLPTEGGENA